MDGIYAQATEVLPLSQYHLATVVSPHLLVAGESSRNLDDMQGRVANFQDPEASGWVDLVGRVLEPALMVGIGLVVLLLSMPIFDLANSVR